MFSDQAACILPLYPQLLGEGDWGNVLDFVLFNLKIGFETTLCARAHRLMRNAWRNGLRGCRGLSRSVMLREIWIKMTRLIKPYFFLCGLNRWRGVIPTKEWERSVVCVLRMGWMGGFCEPPRIELLLWLPPLLRFHCLLYSWEQKGFLIYTNTSEMASRIYLDLDEVVFWKMLKLGGYKRTSRTKLAKMDWWSCMIYAQFRFSTRVIMGLPRLGQAIMFMRLFCSVSLSSPFPMLSSLLLTQAFLVAPLICDLCSSFLVFSRSPHTLLSTGEDLDASHDKAMRLPLRQI